MIVVEPGDTAEALEEESGCPILRNFFDDVRFGDPDFSPSFEALEEHAGCYEMVFILNDEGFGVAIFVPKSKGTCSSIAKPGNHTRRCIRCGTGCARKQGCHNCGFMILDTSTRRSWSIPAARCLRFSKYWGIQIPR